jgi:DNA-binding HxlR family transcriptional regulator
MDRLKPSRSPCPVGRASRILGDRWVILILREAFLGATRFEEFLPNTGINRAALTSRLNALVEHGILERDPPDARRADYRLTLAGHELAPLLSAMRDWGGKWLFDPQDTGGWPVDYRS